MPGPRLVEVDAPRACATILRPHRGRERPAPTSPRTEHPLSMSPELPRRYQVGNQAVDGAIAKLLEQAQAAFGESADAELVREIAVTGVKLMQEHASRGDMKLVTAALKEIRHAL